MTATAGTEPNTAATPHANVHDAAPSGFYADLYRAPDSKLLVHRARSAELKVDNVVHLCHRIALKPRSLLEIGCGDGALLELFHRRGFVPQLGGLEIADEPLALVRRRNLSSVRLAEVFDGRELPVADDSWDLAVLSHVLEHVSHPLSLLTEAARACSYVAVEVPIEDNVFAGRTQHQAKARDVAHVQQFSLASAQAMARWANLEILAARQLCLPTWAYRFHHTSRSRRLAATLGALARHAIYRTSPALAPHVFTTHFAFLCRRPGS